MIHALNEQPAFDRLKHEDWVLIYKHSPLCGISFRAREEVERYVSGMDAVPVYIVDVIRQRPLSRYIAEQLQIRHESPQAILLHLGMPVWHDSHSRVTAQILAEAITKAQLQP